MIKRNEIGYRIALQCYKEGITPSQAKSVLSVIFAEELVNKIVQQVSNFYVAEAGLEAFKSGKSHCTTFKAHDGVLECFDDNSLYDYVMISGKYPLDKSDN